MRLTNRLMIAGLVLGFASASLPGQSIQQRIEEVRRQNAARAMEKQAEFDKSQVGHTPQASRDDGIRHRSVCGINAAFTRRRARRDGVSYLDVEISADAGAIG